MAIGHTIVGWFDPGTQIGPLKKKSHVLANAGWFGGGR